MRARWWLGGLTLVAVLVLGVLAAVALRGPQKMPEAVIVPPCRDRALADAGVAYANDSGAKLTGYVLGDGATGLVLAPQAGHDACAWLPYARTLAGRGYRVLAANYTGEGGSSYVDGAPPSADVAAAVAELRRAGVTRVALIGASRGGTAVVIAASTITPPVDAVVSLSAPGSYGGEDAYKAAPALRVPVLYLVAERDGTFPAASKLLHDTTPGTRELVTVPGAAHGADLVLHSAPTAEAPTAVAGFLMRHAAP